MSREGGKHRHMGARLRSLLRWWEPSCAGTAEKCAELSRIVLLKDRGMSIYPRQPGPLGGPLPGLGAGHGVLPALPVRGLSWLLQLQLVPEGSKVCAPSKQGAPHHSWADIRAKTWGHHENVCCTSS